MAKGANQKLKILYLMKILLEKTDEECAMTINNMISELKSYGIKAERKSIYDDIEELRHYGIDIVSRKTKSTEYFVASRVFELAELKLLVDAVQCSKFITYKKSNELIKKIESLTSSNQAMLLHRQVFISNRIKTINESIYYNVDRLYTAISKDKKVSFTYFDYNIKKERVYRKDGRTYLENPYALSWDDENYYLVSFSEKHNGFCHYRVDRMTNIEIVCQPRVKLPENEGFDIGEYSKKIFNMYPGEQKILKIKFENSLINTVIDRFGKDVLLEKTDEHHFSVRMNVDVSSTFFAWLALFGTRVRIISPDSVIEKYKNYMQEIWQQYNI